MAIYHLSVKAISRSVGRSATASAAYRSACKIIDERTGELHDYTKKSGVVSSDIVLPEFAPDWALDRNQLWNAAEKAEKRKDSCVAREVVVALPYELSPSERKRLAIDFAREMAELEGCAVDVAIHEPSRHGDNRNHHAHLLKTTRKVSAVGLGEKLDTEKAGRARVNDLENLRARWSELVNERLLENGVNRSIDHRSFEDRDICGEPTKHNGPALSAILRRGGTSIIVDRRSADDLKISSELYVIEQFEKKNNKLIEELEAVLKKANEMNEQLRSEEVPAPNPFSAAMAAMGKSMKKSAPNGVSAAPIFEATTAKLPEPDEAPIRKQDRDDDYEFTP